MNHDISHIKQSNPLEVVARRLGLAGFGRRFWCPSCQTAGAAQHRTPDLALYPATGTYCCWKCGSKGDVISLVQLALGCTFKDSLRWLGADEGSHHRQPRGHSSPHNNIIRPSSPTLSQTAPHAFSSIKTSGANIGESPKIARPLGPILQAYQRALPGSLGERYLQSRGISLETATALGIGYSGPGCWLNLQRDTRTGRLVFPHTNSASEVTNFYGRAVELHDVLVPKNQRHDHLPLPKAFFNTASLLGDELILVEGPFCALALYQSGYQNVTATFGVHGFRWEQVKAHRVVLAFDLDDTGSRASRSLAYEGMVRGKTVSFVSSSVYGGHKDLAEAFCAKGKIKLVLSR